MDTREKIVNPEAATALLTGDEWIAVEGLFDPLTAAQATRLAACSGDGRKLLVVILSGDNPLLPAEARAALIAALRCVDAVTIANSARPLVPVGSRVELIEDANEDAARSVEFIHFVLERQQTVAGS